MKTFECSATQTGKTLKKNIAAWGRFTAALARWTATGRLERDAAAAMGIHWKSLSHLKTGVRVPNETRVLAMERLADMAEAGEL